MIRYVYEGSLIKLEITRITEFDLSALKTLYQDVGWHVYLQDMKCFESMFKASQFVLGAKIDTKLVGLVRVVGDGAHIAYIQDLLVMKAYQRQGIGRALLEAALKAVKGVRQKVLITDLHDQKAHRFYEHVGLKNAANVGISCFVHMEN